LLKPRLAPHTLVLWLATPVLFLVALVTIVLAYLRRGRVTAPKPLSAAEVRRLKRILDQS
ncbi:MAG: cytochrome c-type biogenesis protein CcmH, partial [Methyloceanibacter sp.]